MINWTEVNAIATSASALFFIGSIIATLSWLRATNTNAQKNRDQQKENEDREVSYRILAETKPIFQKITELFESVKDTNSPHDIHDWRHGISRIKLAIQISENITDKYCKKIYKCFFRDSMLAIAPLVRSIENSSVFYGNPDLLQEESPKKLKREKLKWIEQLSQEKKKESEGYDRYFPWQDLYLLLSCLYSAGHVTFKTLSQIECLDKITKKDLSRYLWGVNNYTPIVEYILEIQEILALQAEREREMAAHDLATIEKTNHQN